MEFSLVNYSIMLGLRRLREDKKYRIMEMTLVIFGDVDCIYVNEIVLI